MEISGHFWGVGGIKLFYRGWMPQTPRAMLLFIHGAGEHSGHYRNIGEACLDQRIAFVCPDMRGFGQSGGARGHVNNFTDYLEDLEALIQLFRAQYGSIPLFLFGHSFGGLIAIRYGQVFSHKAEGFILSSPALGLRFRIPYLFKKSLELISNVFPDVSIQPFKWARFLRINRQLEAIFPGESSMETMNDPFYTMEYTPRWLAELLRNGIHALLEAPKFRFPLLCIYDKQDPIVHPGAIQQFLDSVVFPDKQFVAFAEGFHKPWHPPHCQQALDNLMSWLNARLQ